MFKRTLERGFTLIELLVVIAIIGILAATVLASLGTARQGGADASIQSQVNSAKAQSEIFFTAVGSYAGVCGNSTNSLTSLLTALVAVSTSTTDTAATSTTAQAANGVFCNADLTRWVVSAPLNAGGFFCADSTGYSGRRTSAITPLASFACPAS